MGKENPDLEITGQEWSDQEERSGLIRSGKLSWSLDFFCRPNFWDLAVLNTEYTPLEGV